MPRSRSALWRRPLTVARRALSVTTGPRRSRSNVVTYDGSATAPTNAGSYAVVATVNDPNFIGQANGILIISKADQQIAFGPLAK